MVRLLTTQRRGRDALITITKHQNAGQTTWRNDPSIAATRLQMERSHQLLTGMGYPRLEIHSFLVQNSAGATFLSHSAARAALHSTASLTRATRAIRPHHHYRDLTFGHPSFKMINLTLRKPHPRRRGGGDTHSHTIT